MFNLKNKWKSSDGYKEIYSYEPKDKAEQKSQKEDEEFLRAVNAGLGCLRYFIAMILLVFLIMIAISVTN